MTIKRGLCGRRLQNTSIAMMAAAAGFVALAAAPAQAAGTLADTLVSNTVTVDYSVGGVPQTQEPATADFRVDRMIDVQVTATDDTVVPGENETTATLVYTVENQGNDTQSYDLTVSEFSDTINLNLSADATVEAGEYALYLDNDGDGALSAGDTWIDPATVLDLTLNPDESVQILLVAEIPLDAGDTTQASFDLVATTLDAGTTNVTTETATPGIGTTDTVFVDAIYAGNFTTDIAEDGRHSDAGVFTVTSADLTADKSVLIISRDPTVDCATATQDADATELFAIPGACIEYTITVSNTGASIVATDVAIADTLPSEITFVAFHSTTSADFSSGEIGDAAPAHAAGVVSATEATLAPGETVILVIRATIN